MRFLPTCLAFVMAVVLFFTPAQAAPAGLTGTWIVGETDGDDYDLLLELRDGAGSLRPLRAGDGFQPLRLSVASTDGPLHRLHLEPRTPGFPPGRAWLLLRTPDEGLFWSPAGDSLMVVRRTATMPASVLGEWATQRPGQRVTVEAERVIINSPDLVETFTATPLASSGGTVDVVLAPEGGEGRLHHLESLPDGSLLLWRHESSEYTVLHRGDGPPAWLEPETPR